MLNIQGKIKREKRADGAQWGGHEEEGEKKGGTAEGRPGTQREGFFGQKFAGRGKKYQD